VAGTLGLSLLLLALATGTSHAALLINRPGADYAALLVQRAPWLRLDLALDFLFLCSYTAFFAAVHAMVRGRDGAAVLPPVWLGALLLSAALDAAENAHLLVLLSMAEQGLIPGQGEIAFQAAASQVKLVANYAGLFALSLVLSRDTRRERVLTWFLRWGQAPLGVAVLVLPFPWARSLALLRTAGLVAGLWAFARIAQLQVRRAA